MNTDFVSRLNHVLYLEQTWYNWAVFLNFLDENRTEIQNLKSTTKHRIYNTLESYRTELSETPIRREEIKPNIYDIFIE